MDLFVSTGNFNSENCFQLGKSPSLVFKGLIFMSFRLYYNKVHIFLLQLADFVSLNKYLKSDVIETENLSKLLR